jgi:hypothetical protein
MIKRRRALAHLSHFAPSSTTSHISPLMLSDHLLLLAEQADSAGLRGTAEHLLDLASAVLDEPPMPRSYAS